MKQKEYAIIFLVIILLSAVTYLLTHKKVAEAPITSPNTINSTTTNPKLSNPKTNPNSFPIPCPMDVFLCPGGKYVGRSGPKCEFACPEEDLSPTINSISPTTGPIGTIIELRGENLAGFEGDLDAIIENQNGEKAYMQGLNNFLTDENLIKVKIESEICKTNNSYSGLPCTSFLKIIPGKYNLYTAPWGKESNKVQFTVTSS